MSDYQMRLLQEHIELTQRLAKLSEIIIKANNGTLEFTLNCPIDLLLDQYSHMRNYNECLCNRIQIEILDA